MRLLIRMMAVLIIMLLFITILPVHGANAVVTDCTNFWGAGTITEAITTANAGGGTITFGCVGTIVFNTQQTISADVTINGGGSITFDGSGLVRFFSVDAGASLTLNSITLTDGSASLGGAVLVNGSFTANNTTFSGNTANLTNGGAIRNFGTTTVTYSTFIDNSAIQNGGAIANDGTLTINSSTFNHNLATNGGAIHNFGSGNIVNSTFINNISTTLNSGGGVEVTGDTTTINHSTFSSNSIATINVVAGNVIMTNSIIDSIGSHCNVIGGSLTADSTNHSNGACGAASVHANLMLGTFTGTVILLVSGSPAQDAIPAPCSVSLDQIANSRPQGSACDAGAYELPITNVALNATASCVGGNLEVNIIAGDPNFQITASSGTLMPNIATTGLVTIFGPLNETGVNVTELGGDTQNFPLGDFNCAPSTVLSASAICVGKDLYVTIANGDAPFQITASSGTLATGLGIGTHIITGPVNETGVNVTELAGDTENFPLGNLTCVETTTPATTPAVTVLGCALDSSDGVEVANAPDNTYCRVLMKNGGVVSYSGAVPANLIQQGVILAVDVYRLQGGMSVNTFPDYAQICLSGSGRYFYMDGRNAPRYAIEMPTEAVDGMTCAWIPAPGTVILTQ